MHNSLKADGTLHACRVGLALRFTESMGALISPISLTWVNYIVESPDHSFVNPPDGKGYGSDINSRANKPILSTFYRPNAASRDEKPGLLLRGLTTQQGTMRAVGYCWYPEAGTVAAAAYGRTVPNLSWNINYHQDNGLVMTVTEYKKIWKTIITIEQGPITTDLSRCLQTGMLFALT